MADEKKKLVYIIDRSDINARMLAHAIQESKEYDTVTETRQPADWDTTTPPTQDGFTTDTIVRDIAEKRPDFIICEDSLSHEPDVASGRKIIEALRKRGINTPSALLYYTDLNSPKGVLPRNTETLEVGVVGYTKKLLTLLDRGVASSGMSPAR